MKYPITEIPPKNKGWAYYAREQENTMREYFGDRGYEALTERAKNECLNPSIVNLNHAIVSPGQTNARKNQMEGR